MTDIDNGKFTIPRPLIEAWRLLSTDICPRYWPKQSDYIPFRLWIGYMPFRLWIVRNHGYLITLAVCPTPPGRIWNFDRNLTQWEYMVIHCRTVPREDSPGAWRCELDLGSPLRNAMALSKFAPCMEISMIPTMSVSFPQDPIRMGTFVLEPFNLPNEVMRWLVSSIWVPLPPVAGDKIRQVANQLEGVGLTYAAHLSLNNGQMSLCAQQELPVQEQIVTEFDLGKVDVSDLSFEFPGDLLTRICVEPMEAFRVAFCPNHRLAALILSDDSAVVYEPKEMKMMNGQPPIPYVGGTLVPGSQDELFTLLRPIGTMEYDGRHSWFDNFDDLFFEAARYLLTTPGKPCVTFEIGVDGEEIFEVARLHHDKHSWYRWFVLKLSHCHNSQALRKICQKIKREMGFEEIGSVNLGNSIQLDKVRNTWRSMDRLTGINIGAFEQLEKKCAVWFLPDNLSPFNLRGSVRQILQIAWGAVPQVFKRVEWRNLDKQHSYPNKVLEFNAERQRSESVPLQSKPSSAQLNLSSSNEHGNQLEIKETQEQLQLQNEYHQLLKRIQLLDQENAAKSPEQKQILAETYERDRELVQLIKKFRGYKCQICGFTFRTKKGENYAECHHLEHLANGGLDISKNMLVVCANCHRQLHFGDVQVIEHTTEHITLQIDNITKTCELRP